MNSEDSIKETVDLIKYLNELEGRIGRKNVIKIVGEVAGFYGIVIATEKPENIPEEDSKEIIAGIQDRMIKTNASKSIPNPYQESTQDSNIILNQPQRLNSMGEEINTSIYSPEDIDLVRQDANEGLSAGRARVLTPPQGNSNAPVNNISETAIQNENPVNNIWEGIKTVTPGSHIDNNQYRGF